MESGDNKGSSTAETNKPIVDAAFEHLKDKQNQINFWGRVGKETKAKDLNTYKGPNGESLLHAAIAADNKDLANELIARGVNLYAVDKDGKTPLHYAIEKGYDKLAQQLFELAPEAAVKGLKSGEKNLLHYAAEKGLTGIAQKMPEHHPLMLGQDKDGKTPLHYAAEKGHAILAKELFNLNPYAAVLKDKDDKTPLHYAAEGGNLELAQELFNLNPGAAASKDSANKTPLHWAAEGGKIKLANTLINGYKAPAGQNQEEALADFITQPSSSGPSAGELLINAYAKNNEKGKVKSDFKAMIKLLEMAPGLTTNPAVQKVLKDTVDAEGKNILHYLDSASPILTNIVTAAPKLATQLDTKSGKSPLHYAAEKGNADLFNKITDAVPNNHVEEAIASQDNDGNTVFHLAAANGHKAMLGDKDSQGEIANLSALNNNGQTPRQVAMANGKVEVADLLHAQEHKLAIEAIKGGNTTDLETLLKNNVNLLNATDQEGNSLLHHAAMVGKDSIVNSLLDKGADITASNKKGQSARAVAGGSNAEAEKCAQAISAKEKQAIFAAVEKGDKALFTKLLEQNPDLVNTTYQDKENKSLIHIAAEKGHTEIISELIAKGAKVDFQDGQSKTALHYASENLHDNVIKKLNEAGANTTLKDSQQQEAATSYDKALLLKHVREGNLEETKKLLDQELMTARDKDGKSILHIAAELGHRDVALAIIKSNPELAEQIDKKGRTPYHYSAAEGHNDISNALVNTKGNGTDQTSIENRKRYENISDGNGKTANHLFKEFQVIKEVREGKTQELTERLTKEPDLINAKDKDGKNLLHIAIESNQMEMVKELVARNPNLMSQKVLGGKDPIETALEKSDDHAFHQVMVQVKANVEPESMNKLLRGDAGQDNGLYHQALAQGKLEHAEIMLFSLDNKEDRLAIVAMPNKEGKNLLHLAAEKGNDQVVSNVLDLVKDVTNEELVALLTAQDKNGDTPLHSAAKAGNREIFEAFVEKVGEVGAAVKGINLAKLEKILEEVEKKKIHEIEALAKETAAENAKSASAQNMAQQAASSNQSHEQKGAAYSKEDFLKGAIDSVKFTPCTGEEKKFNSNNQRAMSDPAATHLSERRNEDGSFSYKLNIVEPNSPTKLHKIEGQFGELIFNGAGEMIGAEIKDPSKLNLLGKEQREQALKLNEEKDQGMTKASVVENLGQPLVAQQQQAKTQATPASILSAPAAAANALPRQGSANIPSSYPSEQQQVPGQRQGGQSDVEGRRSEFSAEYNFKESELEAAAVLARRATPAGPALAHRGGGTKATPAVPAAALQARMSNPVGNGATPVVSGGPAVAMKRGGGH